MDAEARRYAEHQMALARQICSNTALDDAEALLQLHQALGFSEQTPKSAPQTGHSGA